MPDRVHYHPDLIFSAGTKVVSLVDAVGDGGRIVRPRGSVGVVAVAPGNLRHSYRVRFTDGVEVAFKPNEVTLLAQL
jgi:hypothetical protein